MIHRATGRLLLQPGPSEIPVRCGTGFAISKIHVLTAAHCVGDRVIRQLGRGPFYLELRDRRVGLVVDDVDFDLDAALLHTDGHEELPYHLDVLRSEVHCLTWSAFGYPKANVDGLRLTGHVDDHDGRIGSVHALQLRCDQGGVDNLAGSSGAPVCTGDRVFGLIRQGPPCLRQKVIFAAPISSIVARFALGAVLPPAPIVRAFEGSAWGRFDTTTPTVTIDPDEPPWLATLRELIDLDSVLEPRELAALRDGNDGLTRRALLAALREVGIQLVTDRAHAAHRSTAVANDSIYTLLAACTRRYHVARGVIRPVIACHERSVAEICGRAVALHLALLLERHRAYLAEASIAILRAPIEIEIDPRVRITATGVDRLAAHAQTKLFELAEMQYTHLGDEPSIAVDDLLPVPGSVVAGELTLPIERHQECSIAIGPRHMARRELATLRCPAGAASVATVRLPDESAGLALSWKVTRRDARGWGRQVSAGWQRTSTVGARNDIRRELADSSRAERCTRLASAGLWNEVVLDLWPRLDDPEISTDELEILYQILRYAHDWTRRAIPEWRRTDVYGDAVSAVARRIFTEAGKEEWRP
jgi:hypothetical protein